MKKILFTTPFFIIVIGVTLCQGQRIKENKIYYTWVKIDARQQPMNGILHQINDSSLWIRNNYRTPADREILYRNVQSLKFRRKGSVGKGIAKGALLGFAIGGVVGLFIDQCNYLPCIGGGNISVINPNPGPTRSPRAEGFIVLGILSTIPGAIIGGVIGAKKIVIPIDGNRNAYSKKGIEKHLYKQDL